MFHNSQSNHPVLRRIAAFLATYAAFIIAFVVQKPLFMAFHVSQAWGSVWAVMGHGLPMDCAMAGYLAVAPGLLLVAGCFTSRRWPRMAMAIYMGAMAAVISAVCILDLVLYGYWGFRLDATPLFYFATSPSSAMASSGWGEIAGGLAAILALGATYYALFYYGVVRWWPIHRVSRPWLGAGVMVVMTAALFVPIRGGFTVSTMNLSRAYFCDSAILNHSAINPMFSLMYSLTHQGDFAREFRFMDSDEAHQALKAFENQCVADSVASPAFKSDYEKVYLVILESFSAHILPSLGGEPVAMRLDTIANEGILFTNFYGNSFRTDRALPAILSGFPGQPTTSVMKYVSKAEHLPSIAHELGKKGFSTSYFYGGDANFTNMLAYLRSQGYETVVSDKDFPMSQRLSKWGAPDLPVFQKALSQQSRGKMFTVVQTSSSHEPFEPPMTIQRFASDKRKNAFAYADSCLDMFVDSLRRRPDWDKTLVIIVPDHLGGYPKPADVASPASRHHLPLVITGGSIKPMRVATPASQVDIAATLLNILGADHSNFEYSKDIFDPRVPHYGIFSEKEFIGLVAPGDTTIYEFETRKGSGHNVEAAKAHVQTLYDRLSNL